MIRERGLFDNVDVNIKGGNVPRKKYVLKDITKSRERPPTLVNMN